MSSRFERVASLLKRRRRRSKSKSQSRSESVAGSRNLHSTDDEGDTELGGVTLRPSKQDAPDVIPASPRPRFRLFRSLRRSRSRSKRHKSDTVDSRGEDDTQRYQPQSIETRNDDRAITNTSDQVEVRLYDRTVDDWHAQAPLAQSDHCESNFGSDLDSVVEHARAISAQWPCDEPEWVKDETVNESTPSTPPPSQELHSSPQHELEIDSKLVSSSTLQDVSDDSSGKASNGDHNGVVPQDYEDEEIEDDSRVEGNVEEYDTEYPQLQRTSSIFTSKDEPESETVEPDKSSDSTLSADEARSKDRLEQVDESEEVGESGYYNKELDEEVPHDSTYTDQYEADKTLGIEETNYCKEQIAEETCYESTYKGRYEVDRSEEVGETDQYKEETGGELSYDSAYIGQYEVDQTQEVGETGYCKERSGQEIPEESTYTDQYENDAVGERGYYYEETNEEVPDASTYTNRYQERGEEEEIVTEQSYDSQVPQFQVDDNPDRDSFDFSQRNADSSFLDAPSIIVTSVSSESLQAKQAPVRPDKPPPSVPGRPPPPPPPRPSSEAVAKSDGQKIEKKAKKGHKLFGLADIGPLPSDPDPTFSHLKHSSKSVVPNPRKAIQRIIKGESAAQRLKRKEKEELDRILRGSNPRQSPSSSPAKSEEWGKYRELTGRIETAIGDVHQLTGVSGTTTTSSDKVSDWANFDQPISQLNEESSTPQFDTLIELNEDSSNKPTTPVVAISSDLILLDDIFGGESEIEQEPVWSDNRETSEVENQNDWFSDHQQQQQPTTNGGADWACFDDNQIMTDTVDDESGLDKEEDNSEQLDDMTSIQRTSIESVEQVGPIKEGMEESEHGIQQSDSLQQIDSSDLIRPTIQQNVSLDQESDPIVDNSNPELVDTWQEPEVEVNESIDEEQRTGEAIVDQVLEQFNNEIISSPARDDDQFPVPSTGDDDVVCDSETIEVKAESRSSIDRPRPVRQETLSGNNPFRRQVSGDADGTDLERAVAALDISAIPAKFKSKFEDSFDEDQTGDQMSAIDKGQLFDPFQTIYPESENISMFDLNTAVEKGERNKQLECVAKDEEQLNTDKNEFEQESTWNIVINDSKTTDDDTFGDFDSNSIPIIQPPPPTAKPSKENLSNFDPLADHQDTSDQTIPEIPSSWMTFADQGQIAEPVRDLGSEDIWSNRASSSRLPVEPAQPLPDSPDPELDKPFHDEPIEGAYYRLWLRYPEKKSRVKQKSKYTTDRVWREVAVRFSTEHDRCVINLHEVDTDKDTIQPEPYRTIRIEPYMYLSREKLQQYDKYGKLHIFKLKHVAYREIVGVRPEKLSFKMFQQLVSHKPKQNIAVDHIPVYTEILKFGSLDQSKVRNLITVFEDALMQIPAHRDTAISYSREEVCCYVIDEYYADVSTNSTIVDQKARTRIFCTAFVNEGPSIVLGLNDKWRYGREIVRRSDILPIMHDEWISIRKPEFHSLINLTDYNKNHLLSFHPLDGCKFELIRFRVSLKDSRELPLTTRIVYSIDGRQVVMRCELTAQGFFSPSQRAGSVPCENVEIHIPVPDDWIYHLRVEKHHKFGSVHSTLRKPGRIKGLERITQMAQSLLPPSILEASTGLAKYEHLYKAIVWRIPRIPGKHEVSMRPHLLTCKLNLAPHDTVPEWTELVRQSQVEFTMPSSTISGATVRSISVETTGVAEKFVKYQSNYKLMVDIDYRLGSRKEPALKGLLETTTGGDGSGEQIQISGYGDYGYDGEEDKVEESKTSPGKVDEEEEEEESFEEEESDNAGEPIDTTRCEDLLGLGLSFENQEKNEAKETPQQSGDIDELDWS